MERFLTRPATPASSTQGDPEEMLGTFLREDPPAPAQSASGPLAPSAPMSILTPELLDEKLQALLHHLTHIISQAVGKNSQKLKGEIDQLGERTDNLETKFDDLVQYVHVLEEENSTLKHAVTQLQSQQENLENRERRQNLRIRGVLETLSDNNLHSYLLGLFNP